MTLREFDHLLKSNGYRLARNNGHKIYTKGGCDTIAVPRSANKFVLRRLIKENKLKGE